MNIGNFCTARSGGSFAIALGCILAASGAAESADNPAIVAGRVMTSAGEFLPGARVRAWLRPVHGGPFRPREISPTVETLTDDQGWYSATLHLEGAEPQQVWLEASKPGFQPADGFSRRLLRPYLELKPGKSTAASFVLQPGLYVAGQVVDSQGESVQGATVLGGWTEKGGVYDIVQSGPGGRFEMFGMPLEPDDKNPRGKIRFEHTGLLHAEVGNVYGMSAAERTAIRVVMPAGRVIEGQVVDGAGQPLAGALVEALFADNRLRQATLSSPDGRFRLSGLPDAAATLRTHAADWHCKGKLELRIDRDHHDLTLTLSSVKRPKPSATYDLLGLTVADNSPELREFYDLRDHSGVVVLGREAGSPFEPQIDEGVWLDCAGSMVRTVRGVGELVGQMIREIDRNSGRITDRPTA